MRVVHMGEVHMGDDPLNALPVIGQGMCIFENF